MPGFFGFFDYTKEGPGVPANAPPKGPFATFFEILFRKFWKIITINLMYALFSLPAFALALFLAVPLLPMVIPGFSAESISTFLAEAGLSGTELEQAAGLYTLIAFVLYAMMAVGLSFIAVGPVLAGVTYLLRNYAREEHAFVWMDFKEQVKANFKQSMATGALAILVFVALTVGYRFYSDWQVGPILQGLLSGFMVLLSLLSSIMLMYLYPMMVTFKLTLRQLFRNAFMFTMMRLLPNIGILLLSLFLVLGLPLLVLLLAPQAGLVFLVFYFLFLVFGLNLFITNFYVYRQLKKYMIASPADEGNGGSGEADGGSPDSPDSSGEGR